MRTITTGSFLFCILSMLFIPSQLPLLPYQSSLAGVLFGPLVKAISPFIFGIQNPDPHFSSDSASLYSLLLLLLLLGIAGCLMIRSFGKELAIRKVFYAVTPCYLALHLVAYGFDKLFKGQFYLPEPNILFTPFGQMGRDQLYWSTMGTSYTYNLFLGGAELLTGILLLFRKTRLAGKLLSVGILLNIVMVNFGFDISVKLFSLFLLFLSIVLLWPERSRLLAFLSGNQLPATDRPPRAQKTVSRFALEFFIVGFIVMNGLFPYLNFLNFNDDLARKIDGHGAYEVEAGVLTAGSIRRVFIHRDAYLILQKRNDEMIDFKILGRGGQQKWVLAQPGMKPFLVQYDFDSSGQVLIIQNPANRHELIRARKVDLKALPAIQSRFHWTVEELK